MKHLSILALAALLALALLAPFAPASEYNYTAVAATTTSKTVPMTAAEVVVINDGSDTVYVRVFDPGTAPAAATSSNIPVKVGEWFTFANVGAVSVIADSGTATVRLVWR